MAKIYRQIDTIPSEHLFSFASLIPLKHFEKRQK